MSGKKGSAGSDSERPVRGPFYVRLSVEIPRAAEEAAIALIWGLGSCGSETVDLDAERLLLHAYFPSAARDMIGEAAVELAGLGAERVSLARMGTEDWQAGYRKTARPSSVGERFLVDPREPERQSPELHGRFLLRLPARTAFGTGGHPSTDLALRLLERSTVAGRSVLDVGYGTGVLSFAATMLGARSALGLERDLEAALIGGENRALNRVWPRFVAGTLEILGPKAQFDLILANILPAGLLPIVPRIVTLLAADGEVILSGFLRTEIERVLDLLRAAGCTPNLQMIEGEWAALAATRER